MIQVTIILNGVVSSCLLGNGTGKHIATVRLCPRIVDYAFSERPIPAHENGV